MSSLDRILPFLRPIEDLLSEARSVSDYDERLPPIDSVEEGPDAATGELLAPELIFPPESDTDEDMGS